MTPPPTPTTTTIDPAVHANRWKILVVLCLSLMVIMIANGSLNVALPQLATDLSATSSSLQWMVDAYSLVFAGMLFTAGTIGDRFGRKLALQAGMVVFLLGAVGASMANSAGQVTAARAVMGLAAAFVMPSTLSLLMNVFEPHERPKAISIWAGIAAGGAALGPPTSGFLLEHFWWGSVFLINVPLLLVAIVAGRLLLPESKDPDEHRIDVPGAVLSILGIGALVYAIIEAPEEGWASAHTATAFAVAAIALAAFVVREMHRAGADVRSRACCATRASRIAAMGVVAVLLRHVRRDVPARRSTCSWCSATRRSTPGCCMLPMPLILMVLAPQAPALVNRFGIGRVVPVGLGAVAVGQVILSFLGTQSHGWGDLPRARPR